MSCVLLSIYSAGAVADRKLCSCCLAQWQAMYSLLLLHGPGGLPSSYLCTRMMSFSLGVLCPCAQQSGASAKAQCKLMLAGTVCLHDEHGG
jgi:hypothetical protein